MKERAAKDGIAKDGGRSTFIKTMRERYDRAVEADRESRELALDDLRFVTVPGSQWDERQKKARGKRPCYEFPILRSHWRQVVNDQKKSRPGIKVRAVENGDAKGAELRQGLLRNIESSSNAEWAYDAAFELLVAAGMGSWRIKTAYAHDDAWDQDLCIEPITDPLTSVWWDPDAKSKDQRDARYCFVEESISRDEFQRRYPKATVKPFQSAMGDDVGWWGQEMVRIAEYWRLEPVTKTLLLLSDGRTVNAEEVDPEDLAAQGIEVVRQRECKTDKVVMSIVSGEEELEGPFDSVFHRIPIVSIWGNRVFIDGKWTWCGMVRWSRDPQKLLNYNLTTAQEIVSKQPKSPYLVTPKMLTGNGVKELWDRSGAADLNYLTYTPDDAAPGGKPFREPPPDLPTAFTALTQLSVDMLKASDGIFDASVGARSNETSGRAIMARQQEGDTATFDYHDALAVGIQATGEILLPALPKVYDTPRAVRVLGKDGGEDYVQLYSDQATDLSAGKYDVTMTAGGNYETQRMEFVEALSQLGQANPLVAQATADLVIGAMDFPKADEAAERIKAMLPPPIQQMLQQKDESPAVMQMQQQMQQMQQMAEQHIQMLQEQLQQAEAKAQSKVADELKAQIASEELRIKWFEAETARLALFQKDAHKAADLEAAANDPTPASGVDAHEAHQQ